MAGQQTGAPSARQAPERVTLATCIGCGARDLWQPCTGDCSDLKLELVPAAEYEHLLAQAADARRSAPALLAIAQRLAADEPAPGRVDAAYRELRAAASDALHHTGGPATEVTETPPEPAVTWWCPGCGRIEAPQPCIGVCVRQPEELVRASLYDEARKETTAALREQRLLAGLARMVASVQPRDGEWERTRQAMRARARAVLSALSDAPESQTAG